MNRLPSLILFVALLGSSPTLRAQNEEEGQGNQNAIREVAPGVLEVGLVRLDQKARTVTFPGAINMDKGLVEYLLVGRNGPTHESLLVTDVRPVELHTAMALLGAKSPPPVAAGQKAQPPAQLTPEYLKHAPKLGGDPISFTATWKDKEGAEKTTEVSDWLIFTPTKKPPTRGPWLYTGSIFGADNKFLAQQEDLFAGLVTNPAALINNPRKGNDDDRLWIVNEKQAPPVETPLVFTLKLLETKTDQPPKQK